MLGYSVEPNKVIERTRHFLAQGFTAFKWFLPGAPKDGEPGIRRNLASFARRGKRRARTAI